MLKHLSIPLIVSWALMSGPLLATDDAGSWDGTIVQYGTMHEAIGQQQHHGRVSLSELAKPGFYGVAALERLAGEVTIHDGQLTVTTVGARGPRSIGDSSENLEATLLVGARVPSWKESEVNREVEAVDFDKAIAAAAAAAGIDTSRPFVFTARGEFIDLDYHVINGACPMHARLKKIELTPEQSPFEGRLDSVRGTLVGVFAKSAVGELTHPGTSTHAHVIFRDVATGETLTGHVESVGLKPGTVLGLPD
jgi:alpha-acetolactate decarboxylase